MSRSKKVPVDIWAKQYETSVPIADAEVTDMHTGQKWKTGHDGYARICVKPGRVLTLKFNKASFPAIQTATVTVPPEGLTGHDDEITLQVPGKKLYQALIAAFGKPRHGLHHVVVTVAAEGKNLHDDAGESGVVLCLRSTATGKVVRDDAVYLGNILGKTEWLRPIATARVPFLNKYRHKSTSHDGGAMFLNVPPGEYVIEARKTGRHGQDMVFRSSRVTVFDTSPETVNVSTPHGPKVLPGQGKKVP